MQLRDYQVSEQDGHRDEGLRVWDSERRDDQAAVLRDEAQVSEQDGHRDEGLRVWDSERRDDQAAVLRDEAQVSEQDGHRDEGLRVWAQQVFPDAAWAWEQDDVQEAEAAQLQLHGEAVEQSCRR